MVLNSSWRDPIGLYAARFYEVPFDDICPDMPEEPRRTEILLYVTTRSETPFHPERRETAVMMLNASIRIVISRYKSNKWPSGWMPLGQTTVGGRPKHRRANSRALRVLANDNCGGASTSSYQGGRGRERLRDNLPAHASASSRLRHYTPRLLKPYQQ